MGALRGHRLASLSCLPPITDHIDTTRHDTPTLPSLARSTFSTSFSSLIHSSSTPSFRFSCQQHIITPPFHHQAHLLVPTDQSVNCSHSAILSSILLSSILLQCLHFTNLDASNHPNLSQRSRCLHRRLLLPVALLICSLYNHRQLQPISSSSSRHCSQPVSASCPTCLICPRTSTLCLLRR